MENLQTYIAVFLGTVLTFHSLYFFQNNQQITKNVFYIYHVSDILNRILGRCIVMKTIWLSRQGGRGGSNLVWKSLGYIHSAVCIQGQQSY
jgi:hypothetical protein